MLAHQVSRYLLPRRVLHCMGYPECIGTLREGWARARRVLGALGTLRLRRSGGGTQGEIFAAEGFGKVTGEVGVCIATSGPGATNLVTGLADALLDSVPMVAITGQVRDCPAAST